MIIVIGAGASGLVAAIEAAKYNEQVMIIERNDRPGKKIYATGNGKCNLTNTYMNTDCFRGSDKSFIEKTINRFGYRESMEYFKGLGLMFKDKNGYIYPASGQASSVVEALVLKCMQLDIKILCNTEVLNITPKPEGFEIITNNGKYKCNKVILSSGSNAGINKQKIPKKTGYDMAYELGCVINPVVPALTGLKCKDLKFYKSASGVRCDAKIKVLSDNKYLAEEMGELQITDYGISGIPTFQVSRYASLGVYENKKVEVTIDFAAEYDKDMLSEFIVNKYESNKNIRLIQLFNGVVNDKLAKAVIEKAGYDMQIKLAKVKYEDILKMTDTIKSFHDEVISVNDMQNSQVACGGISLSEINEDFEHKKHKGFFITGEVLDVDGICGGYNLQWAFASGYIAGNRAGKEK